MICWEQKWSCASFSHHHLIYRSYTGFINLLNESHRRGTNGHIREIDPGLVVMTCHPWTPVDLVWWGGLELLSYLISVTPVWSCHGWFGWKGTGSVSKVPACLKSQAIYTLHWNQTVNKVSWKYVQELCDTAWHKHAHESAALSARFSPNSPAWISAVTAFHQPKGISRSTWGFSWRANSECCIQQGGETTGLRSRHGDGEQRDRNPE